MGERLKRLRKKGDIIGVTAVVDDCSICLSPLQDLSAINGCDHKFCFSCIKQWSASTNTCPLCKSRFDRIKRQSTDQKTNMVIVKKKDQKVEYSTADLLQIVGEESDNENYYSLDDNLRGFVVDDADIGTRQVEAEEEEEEDDDYEGDDDDGDEEDDDDDDVEEEEEEDDDEEEDIPRERFRRRPSNPYIDDEAEEVTHEEMEAEEEYIENEGPANSVEEFEHNFRNSKKTREKDLRSYMGDDDDDDTNSEEVESNSESDTEDLVDDEESDEDGYDDISSNSAFEEEEEDDDDSVYSTSLEESEIEEDRDRKNWIVNREYLDSTDTDCNTDTNKGSDIEGDSGTSESSESEDEGIIRHEEELDSSESNEEEEEGKDNKDREIEPDNSYCSNNDDNNDEDEQKEEEVCGVNATTKVIIDEDEVEGSPSYTQDSDVASGRAEEEEFDEENDVDNDENSPTKQSQNRALELNDDGKELVTLDNVQNTSQNSSDNDHELTPSSGEEEEEEVGSNAVDSSDCDSGHPVSVPQIRKEILEIDRKILGKLEKKLSTTKLDNNKHIRTKQENGDKKKIGLEWITKKRKFGEISPVEDNEKHVSTVHIQKTQQVVDGNNLKRSNQMHITEVTEPPLNQLVRRVWRKLKLSISKPKLRKARKQCRMLYFSPPVKSPKSSTTKENKENI